MRAVVVAFVGRSGSGKTTLIERLIPVLAEKGVRVAIVKHSPVHNVETDTPGRDTHRFWMAGARHVALATREAVVHRHRFDEEPALETVLAGIHDVDLILLEGDKRSDVPKIEVIRRGHDHRPIEALQGRIAVVTDLEEKVAECPHFPLDPPDALARFLIETLGMEE